MSDAAKPTVRILVVALFAFAVLTLSACSVQDRVNRFAKQAGYSVDIVQGQNFLHKTFANKQYQRGSHKSLHIYIEGDGKPWYNKSSIAVDPTAQTLIMAKLMALDFEPSIYLGRPCYLGVADPACEPIWWTYKRYSPEVVNSLVEAVIKLSPQYTELVLIGHSGGGALSVLMAHQLMVHQLIDKDTSIRVVTLAANLDIAAWAQHHGYTPLHGSSNPMELPPLPRRIHQWHYVGERDASIFPRWVESFADMQPGANFVVLKEIDHNCCWRKHWPGILTVISAK